MTLFSFFFYGRHFSDISTISDIFTYDELYFISFKRHVWRFHDHIMSILFE